jgi:hypothetical protein
MAKKLKEEVVVPEVVTEVVEVQEVVLNIPPPERIDPGHHSRDLTDVKEVVTE